MIEINRVAQLVGSTVVAAEALEEKLRLTVQNSSGNHYITVIATKVFMAIHENSLLGINYELVRPGWRTPASRR